MPSRIAGHRHKGHRRSSEPLRALSLGTRSNQTSLSEGKVRFDVSCACSGGQPSARRHQPSHGPVWRWAPSHVRSVKVDADISDFDRERDVLPSDACSHVELRLGRIAMRQSSGSGLTSPVGGGASLSASRSVSQPGNTCWSRISPLASCVPPRISAQLARPPSAALVIRFKVSPRESDACVCPEILTQLAGLFACRPSVT